MKETINQQNLYLLLPAKVSRMAEMLVDDKGLSMIDALKKVYASAVYKRLEDERTKAWHLGPATLYYDMIHENETRNK